MRFSVCVQDKKNKNATVTFSFDDWAKTSDFLYICMCQGLTVDLIAIDNV